MQHSLVVLLVAALVLGSLALANAETLLHDEPPGTIITFSGMQWVILEQMPNGETYILLKDPIGERAFDLNDTNNLYNPSDTNNIAYYLNNDFYNSLSQKELVADHSWDRISVDRRRVDSTDYGNVTCKIGLLSYREYERYSKYYNSNGILPRSYSYWWWTRTPYTESPYFVWYVGTDGYLDRVIPLDHSGGSVRPALYLKSGILIDQNKVVVGQGNINRPASPSGVSANAESSTSVNISWQANTEADLAGYKIYRNNTEIANVDKTVTTYNDVTVAPGITYTYEITAYNTSNLESGRSSPVTVTTSPATPTGVTGQVTGKDIILTWQCPGNPEFIVERSSDGINFIQVAEVTETSFTETAPLWDTTYYYRVAQKGQDGTVSDFSEAVQITTGVLPVPENLQASVSYNNITLTWDSVDGADAYIIQRSMDAGDTWDNIGEVTQTTYTDDGLGWNLTFSYRIVAKSGEQVSNPSAAISATTDNVPAPTGLTASLSGNDVTLNWQAAPYVTMYIIERSTDGLTWEFLVEVGNTTYTDMDLALNSDYYYRVRSDGLNQVSEPSNTVKVTAPPAAPTNLQANVDGTTVTLKWNGQDSMTFIIERSNDGHTWGQVAEVTEKTCQDTVPSWETIYYYRVLAKNSDGMISEPSETAQAVIPAIPEPTGLTANVSGNTINLSWSGVKGISTYRIERSQNGIFWDDLIEVNATSYQDTDLAWETKYYYRVRAVDGDQVSKPSETVSAETPVPPAPEAPRITYIVDNTNVEMSWNYQRNCDGYKVYINNSLAAELPSSKTNYSFTGERGKSYTVVIEAYNAYGKASSSITVNISEMPTPGAGTMAGDVLKYTGAVVASTGGLLALGLALKGSGGLIAIIRMFLGR